MNADTAGPARAIGMLLRCYPRAFRARFGEELRATYVDAYTAAASRGWRARTAFWMKMVWDAAVAGVAERLDPGGANQPQAPRPSRRRGWFDATGQDLRFAYRSLQRRPGLVAVITITLAVGIGANAAVFTLFDAVLLRPVAVARPEALVVVGIGAATAASRESRLGAISYPDYLQLRDGTRSLAGLAAHGPLEVGMVAGEVTQRLPAALVTGEYFGVLGLRAQVGRLLDPADAATPGAAAVTVLSDGVWDRVFARDRNVIGRTVELNGHPFTVVGVAPRSFRGSALYSPSELWIPITMVRSVGAGGLLSQDVLNARVFPWLGMIGRMRPGVTAAQVGADLDGIYAGVREGASVRTEDAAERERVEEAVVGTLPFTAGATLYGRADLLNLLGLLAAVVGLTLAIACVNVANVLLVRSAERSKELAIRLALGVSRARLVRQLVLESVLLAFTAGLAGLAVGWILLRVVRAFTIGRIPLSGLELGLDGRVLAFATLISLAAALAAGLGPAWIASRTEVLQRLRDAQRGDRTASSRPRGGLVLVQVALTMVLLTGAGLFLRSLRSALNVELGFDARPVAAVSFGLRQHGYDTADEARAFLREVLRRVRLQPGIAAAGLAQYVPVSGAHFYFRPHLPDSPSEDAAPRVSLNPVSAGFFEALRIPLVSGRLFLESDDERSPAVAIVTRAAAERLWPGETALGRPIQLWQGVGAVATVVGVVEDGHYGDLRDRTLPYLFVPAMQNPGLAVLERISVVTRGSGDARHALRVLKQEIARLDPKLPLFDERRVADQLDVVLMPQRFGATLLTWFAAAALLIAGVGVYGVVGYTVALRRREIGIRRALGADHGDVVRVVARASAAWTLAGIAIGTLAAAATTRAAARFLFDVTPLDAWSFAGAALLLVAAGTLAVALPLRRALRVEPLESLRG